MAPNTNQRVCKHFGEVQTWPTVNIFRRIFLLFLFLGMVGCHSTFVKTHLVTVKASPNANLNQPTTVDVVLVYDRALVPLFTSLTTREWFEKRALFQDRYQSRLKILTKEVPPNTADSFDIDNQKATAVLLFVHYQTPETRYPQRLDEMKRVTVFLEKHQVMVLDSLQAERYSSMATTTPNFQRDILDRFGTGRDKTSQAIRTVYLQVNEPLYFLMSPRTPETVTVYLLSAAWHLEQELIFPVDDKVKTELENQQRYWKQQQDLEGQKIQQLQENIQRLTCQRLQLGMTEAEVNQVLGKPWQYGPTLPEAGSFFLIYHNHQTLLFKNARLYQVMGGEFGCR